MDVGRWFEEAVKILKLDEDAIRRAAASDGATRQAVVFVAIAGLAHGIGRLDIFDAVLFPFLMPMGLAFGVAVLWALARLFGGTASYAETFRPLGLAWLADWVSVVPYAGPFIGTLAVLWLLVVYVVTLRTVHGISTGAAIAVVLLPIAIAICLGGGTIVAMGGRAALAGAFPGVGG